MRASATSPDISITELGQADADRALRLFREHPWAAEIQRADTLGAQGNSISPDLTFSDLPAHMVVSGEASDRFNVEICLPRERRILGLFGAAKFYQFRAISPRQVEELIHAFFEFSLAARHAAVRAVHATRVPQGA